MDRRVFGIFGICRRYPNQGRHVDWRKVLSVSQIESTAQKFMFSFGVAHPIMRMPIAEPPFQNENKLQFGAKKWTFQIQHG